MKTMLFKHIFMKIRQNYKRFLSLLFMALLGIGFYAGIEACSPDMLKTLDKFYDDNNVYDISIFSNLGLDDNDIDRLSNIDGVDKVIGSYEKDTYLKLNNEQYVIKVIGLNDNINKVYIEDGRLPNNNDEIVVEKKMIVDNNLSIGDSINILGSNKKIVGTIISPLYFSTERPSTNLGSGKVNYYAYTLSDLLKSDYYSVVYLTIKDTMHMLTNSKEYQNTINNFVEKINVIKKDTDISIAERRKLATMPELTTKSLFDGTYFKKFDSYVTDQFVERDAFRKIKIDIELSTKGEYNNLYMYDDYIVEEIFPLNSNSINNLTSKINYIKDTYLNDNSNIYYTIIPDKNYFVNKGNLKLDYNKLQDMMKSNLTNLNYINIFDKLTLDNYYKTDTHWKQEDLFDVANTIANQMNFDITNNNVVNTITTFKGSYAGRLSVTKDIDTIKTISNPSTLNSSVYNYETKKYTQIYDYDKIKSLDKYDIYLSGASSIIDIVNPTSNSNRELIVFRDSYGSSLVPLLIDGYKKITVIDIRYVSSRILNNYIKFNNQDVLFMYSILTINNSFSMR